jgi:hypothetical protein
MKKSFLPLAALLLSSQVFAQNLTSVPFYFAVPASGHAPLADKSWVKVPVKEVQTDKAYLRAYKFVDKNILVGGVVGKSPGAVVAAKRKTRAAAIKELFKKGVLKSGDVVLSFRPSWENTIPYSHVQMGVSHAGTVYVENGVVHNLDMPLDAEYNGEGISSGFDSNHYIETDHLQVVRPRSFSTVKQANLLAWVAQLRKNYTSIRGANLLKFNPDYSNAKIDKYGAGGDSFVTTMGKILVGQNKTSSDLTMFCSEFAWSMQAIVNCSPAQISAETSADAPCVQPGLEATTMLASGNLPGLTEGPLYVLESLDIGLTEKNDLMKKIFVQGEMSGLSSGHRALATNPAVQQLMGALAMFYPASLNGNSAAANGIAAQVNPAGGRNYSPTSFLINAMLEPTDPERKYDYVATIMFAPAI